ncbi:MAG: uroporphyrinogen decarboxylase family protein [Armatimonadota bacterium]|nr:uroporphyrinogen decarboxylase family protein [Armatimonadota bacterium]
MTPREVIIRNLEGTGPARIGMAFSGGRRNDFRSASVGPSERWTQRRWVEGNVEYYDDEWGNVWHRLVHMGKGGEIYRPALQEWSMLDDYQLPDLANPRRYQRAAEIFAAETERYRLGNLPGFPFAICRYLRKMEVYFADLILERQRIDQLHERVTDLLAEMIHRWADAGADGIFFCEDWGVQDHLLVRPAMWRDIFKPLFARLCATAHARGMHVLMHSCGYLWDIIDDLAEVGVNALQFDQPSLYGLERLAARFRQCRLCLFSPVDIQKVLPTGDRALIERTARQMIQLFEGQFIAKNYGDLHGIGVDPQWDDWAYQVFASACEGK